MNTNDFSSAAKDFSSEEWDLVMAASRKLTQAWDNWHESGTDGPRPRVRALFFHQEFAALQSRHTRAFLSHLLNVELDLRKKCGVELPELSEWKRDFPEYAAVVEEVLVPPTAGWLADDQPDGDIGELERIMRGDGEVIGEFSGAQPIGRGATAVVYQAQDTNFKQVALKVLRFDVNDKSIAGRLKDLVKEITNHINLQHAHVVKVIGLQFPDMSNVKDAEDLRRAW